MAVMTAMTAMGVCLLLSTPGWSAPGLSTPGSSAPMRAVSLPDATPLDTVVSVQRGDLLRIENFSGDLLVRSWDRSEVSIEFDERRDSDLDVVRRAGVVEVRASQRKGRERNHSYVVSVPVWLPVEIRGGELDVRAEGLEARLEVGTREGDISVRNHSGDVLARTLDGVIDVRDSRGRFELRSLDDDVRVSNIQGDLFIEANDGDIEMLGVDARIVEAGTLEGDIDFSGVIQTGGLYELTTHDGDISFEVGAGAAAEFSVATYDGEFETEFLVSVQKLDRSRELNFELGGGGAQVRLQAFDGTIRLLEAR